MSDPAIGIRPRVKVAGINRSMLLAALLGGISYATLPGASDVGGVAIGFTAGLLALGFVIRAARLAFKDYALRRDLARSKKNTKLHGSARQSTKEERGARGSSDWRNGELLGLDEDAKEVFRQLGASFMLVEIPPGGFKTAGLVIGSALHRAELGSSVFLPDVKRELSVMLEPALRERGIETWVLKIGDVGSVEINVFQRLLDAVHGNADQRKDAVKIASDIAEILLPIKGDEKNPYFVHGSQRAIRVALLYLALFEPELCTPTGLYLLLTDPARFAAACARLAEFDGLDEYASIAEVVRVEARNLTSRAEHNRENYKSFLEGASQRLVWANPAGHLGHFGANATHQLSSMRDRQIVLFLPIPLSHLREFSDFTTLVNEAIIYAAKAKPDGHPIHFIGEEFLNYRAPNIVSDLETLRQLRVTADFYVQSYSGLEKAYGKEAAASIAAYADITIIGSLNAYDRAKYVEERLARETVRTQDASFGADVKDISLSTKETGRPLMTADEILAMDRREVWMLCRGMRPTRLSLVHYGEVSPWRDWVRVSPITGTKLRGDVRVTIPYPEKRDAR